MKNDSPNKFLGALTAGIAGSRGSGGAFGSFLNSALGRAAAQVAGPTQAQQAASGGLAGAIGSSLGGSLLGGNTNLASDLGAAMAPTGGDMQDPFAGKTFSIVESPANMKGNAKPVFNKSTSDAAAMMYGSPAERQMSMPKAGTSAMSMSAKQEKAFGPGSEVYESGNTAIYEGLKEKE